MEINLRPPKSNLAPVSTVLRNRGSLFEVIILLIVGGLAAWFVVLPKISELKAVRAQVELKQEESAQLSTQQGKLENLVRQLDSSGKELTKLDESLPLHNRNTWVYLLVESLVQSSGMTVGSLAVANSDDQPVAGDLKNFNNIYTAPRSIKKMGVNLAVTGTFAQFQALLEKIENSARIMDIKTLDISTSADQLLDFRITFDTYYYGK